MKIPKADIHRHLLELEPHEASDTMAAVFNDMELGLRRVSDVVDNMSLFARSQCDIKQMVDINDCIRSASLRHRPLIKQCADLKLTLVDLPELELDACKINQLLSNIIVNAIQSMQMKSDNGQKGKLQVSSKLVSNQINVCISDTGCGIEKKDLQKVFDPFYTTKNEQEATGLGLAISYDIAKHHDGNLSVTSEVGKGSVFTLSLPLRHKILH